MSVCQTLKFILMSENILISNYIKRSAGRELIILIRINLATAIEVEQEFAVAIDMAVWEVGLQTADQRTDGVLQLE